MFLSQYQLALYDISSQNQIIWTLFRNLDQCDSVWCRNKSNLFGDFHSFFQSDEKAMMSFGLVNWLNSQRIMQHNSEFLPQQLKSRFLGSTSFNRTMGHYHIKNDTKYIINEKVLWTYPSSKRIIEARKGSYRYRFCAGFFLKIGTCHK